MSIHQRIDELIDDYRSSHYNAPGAVHPAIKRRLDRDVDAFSEDLDALLLAVQDEQKEEAVKHYFGTVHEEDIKEIPYAYNPKKEVV